MPVTAAPLHRFLLGRRSPLLLLFQIGLLLASFKCFLVLVREIRVLVSHAGSARFGLLLLFRRDMDTFRHLFVMQSFQDCFACLLFLIQILHAIW